MESVIEKKFNPNILAINRTLDNLLYNFAEEIKISRINLMQKKYNLYKTFLKKYKNYYNIFCLTDFIKLIKERKTFTGKQIKQKWEKYFFSRKNKESLDLLVYIPFCQQKCTFCRYYSKPYVKKELTNYLNYLISQMYFLKNTFEQVEFNSLVVTGGTPSLLSEEQLKQFFSTLFYCFKFKKTAGIEIDCHPENTTLKKLKILKKLGFNQIHLGVQNFDKKVLKKANRGFQKTVHVEENIKNAKVLGFEINADLMVGIKGDNIESITESFVNLAKLKTHTITLYPFQPPDFYIKGYLRGNYSGFSTQLNNKMKKTLKELKKKAKELNYYLAEREHDIDYLIEKTFSLKGFEKPYCSWDYMNANYLPKPSSVLCFGAGGGSMIFNSLKYEETFGGKINNFNPETKSYSGIKFSKKDEMRYFILQHLSHKTCFSQKEFKTFFKSSFKTNFRTAIKNLKSINKIKIKGDLVFLPTDPLERYTTVLFLFNEKDVSKKIKEV